MGKFQTAFTVVVILLVVRDVRSSVRVNAHRGVVRFVEVSPSAALVGFVDGRALPGARETRHHSAKSNRTARPRSDRDLDSVAAEIDHDRVNLVDCIVVDCQDSGLSARGIRAELDSEVIGLPRSDGGVGRRRVLKNELGVG